MIYINILLFIHFNIFAQDVYQNELIDNYLPKFLKSISKRKVKRFFDKKVIYFYDKNSINYLYKDNVIPRPSVEQRQFLRLKSYNKIIHIYPCKTCMYSYSINSGNAMLHISEGIENSKKVVFCQLYKIKKVKEIELENGHHSQVYDLKIILRRKFILDDVQGVQGGTDQDVLE